MGWRQTGTLRLAGRTLAVRRSLALDRALSLDGAITLRRPLTLGRAGGLFGARRARGLLPAAGPRRLRRMPARVAR